MPTNHDETIAQRYQREGREHLDMLAMMTPEQIRDLELQAHNALCDVDRLNVELAALKAEQGEAVAHVSEESFSSDGTSDIITRNLPIGTALYTAPPASADAVSVPRESLEMALDILLSILADDEPLIEELRALLAQSQGVK